MRIIKDVAVVDDAWQGVEDGGPIPVDGNIIVSWRRWLTERETLNSAQRLVGVRIEPDMDVAALEPYLGSLPLVALEFPKFGDGRGFSQARLLRDRYRYKGELRAVGYVTRDLLLFMRRCGIDSFVLRETQDPEAALQAFHELTVNYQTAADGKQPIYYQRR